MIFSASMLISDNSCFIGKKDRCSATQGHTLFAHRRVWCSGGLGDQATPEGRLGLGVQSVSP
jgi:hypothetical protein